MVVNLATSGMNYSPEMEGTPMRNFLLGLKWMNLRLVQIHIFDEVLEAERHTFNLPALYLMLLD